MQQKCCEEFLHEEERYRDKWNTVIPQLIMIRGLACFFQCFLVFICFQPSLVKPLLNLERISNSFTLMPIELSSLWYFRQAGLLDVYIVIPLSQSRTESQQELTTTGGCIVSLQIMHSNQSRISLTITFCTAMCCNAFWQFLVDSFCHSHVYYL